MKEELGLDCNEFKFITKLPHRTILEEIMIYYFSCEGWKGEPKSLDAEKIFWIGLEELNDLDFEIDKKAIKEFLRIQAASGADKQKVKKP